MVHDAGRLGVPRRLTARRRTFTAAMESFERILVRMPNWLGDVVMATPLLRTLREAYPRAQLDLLIQPGGALVLAGVPFVDDVLLYHRKSEHKSRYCQEQRYGSPDVSQRRPDGSTGEINLTEAHYNAKTLWHDQTVRPKTTTFDMTSKIHSQQDEQERNIRTPSANTSFIKASHI